MKNDLHVMLDLETFGLGMDAPVVAIGACAFDSVGIHDTFRATISLKDAVVHGAKIDPDTVEFWMKQIDEARATLLDSESGFRRSLDSALLAFGAWLQIAGGGSVDGLAGLWGNGAAFDNALLRETYRRSDIPCPWSYKIDRCFRTAKMDSSLVFDRDDRLIEHDATHDAVYQAEWLLEIWSEEGRI